MLTMDKLADLLVQALESERSATEIYASALQCAVDVGLAEEWTEYLEETRRHERVLLGVLEKLGIDPELSLPSRDVVRHHGASLLRAIQMARDAGDPAAAEIEAAECVMLAETKDHRNWELLSLAAANMTGLEGKTLREACAQVAGQEEEHLAHTKAWSRALQIRSLGLPAEKKASAASRLRRALAQAH